MSESRPRRRKRRKVFTRSYDEDELDNEVANAELRAFGFLVDEETEEDQGWGWDLKSKLEGERFVEHFEELVERMEGKDYNAGYFHEHGFKKPIYFEKADDLGLLVPSGDNFSVQDVKKLVGASRVIDVMDVKTQKGSQMTLREFVDYFQRKEDRTRLLNVLSLEFSKTKLADFVRAPAVVRGLDWVELAWPQELREQQTDSTNALNSMKYPKVQNYCLMSVGDCYTDFHVDFGGTSVWYHVLRGEKLFWLIPPTDENCQHFQAWTLSGRQNKTFFGDLVEKCVRIRLKAGDTFMIPSGWIHAVYTPVDSLVFGGNFLHSFAIPMQLSVYEIERNTHVPGKFRYPFFLEMQWYVLERYYSILTGGTFLRRNTEADMDEKSDEDVEKNLLKGRASLLSDAELEGLHTLVDWLHSLPNSKRQVPDLIIRPSALLKKFQELLSILDTMERQPAANFLSLLSLGRSQDFNEAPQAEQQYAKLAVQEKGMKVGESDLKKIVSNSSPQSFDQGIHSYASPMDSAPSSSMVQEKRETVNGSVCADSEPKMDYTATASGGKLVYTATAAGSVYTEASCGESAISSTSNGGNSASTGLFHQVLAPSSVNWARMPVEENSRGAQSVDVRQKAPVIWRSDGGARILVMAPTLVIVPRECVPVVGAECTIETYSSLDESQAAKDTP